ncbi:MAG TPA: DUF559 domain-containing protein [Thermoleophilaceae bacterium]|nr:DUF559 domain-containing protein [Thermoleophilaceae bacterium]
MEGTWLAAVLACGEGAVLSHASAAALWGIRPSAASHIDVTVPTRSGRARRRGIRVHRPRRFNSDDVTALRGVPTTTVARTLVGLADVLPTQALKRAIDEAEYRKLLDTTALFAAVQANPGRRGTRLLALARAPAELTRSELEQRFLELLETERLPRPSVAAHLEGFEVDFLWPEERLIVEIDGLAAHGTRAALERDRTRDRRLLLAGYRTVRLTARTLETEPQAVVSDLRELLNPYAGTSSERKPARRSRASSKPPSRPSTSSARAA